MARGKKKETLTPEERLQAALVPVSEQPYPVPENWCWTRMENIAQWGSGGTPSRKIPEYYNGDIPWIKTGELNDDYIFETEEHITEEAISHSSAKLFPVNTVAIAMYGATIGKVGILGVAATTNQACACGVSNSLANYKYLFYYARSQKDNFIKKGKGGAQPNISQEIIKSHEFPLPPLSEQHRIVDRIESLFAKLDEAKQKAQDALDSFETRKAAILHRAFTGELTSQWRKEHGVGMESWENLKIGTYAQVKGGKRLPKGHKLVTERTTHPYLRIADFGDGTINDSDLNYITEDTFSQIKNYIINKEDVYISIVGSIGKAGVIPESLNGANLTENAARIISSRTLPRYLSSFLSSPKAQNDIQNRIRSATLGKLSLLNIKDIETPVPSIEEQTEIVRILDDLLAKEQQAKEAAEGVLEQIDLIKKAILARAFRGELGTNDPSEESAVELLKQISSC